MKNGTLGGTQTIASEILPKKRRLKMKRSLGVPTPACRNRVVLEEMVYDVMIGTDSGIIFGRPWLTVLVGVDTGKFLAHIVTISRPDVSAVIRLFGGYRKQHRRLPEPREFREDRQMSKGRSYGSEKIRNNGRSDSAVSQGRAWSGRRKMLQAMVVYQ
jgi:hypothetical protein